MCAKLKSKVKAKNVRATRQNFDSKAKLTIQSNLTRVRQTNPLSHQINREDFVPKTPEGAIDREIKHKYLINP